MQKGEPRNLISRNENERKGRRVGVYRGERRRQSEGLIRLREAHASLIVGVGNVLTHERNRERKRGGDREKGKKRDRASRVALMPGRPYVCTVSRCGSHAAGPALSLPSVLAREI